MSRSRLFLAALLVLHPSGCTMRGSGTLAAPAFARASREHAWPVTARTHRVGDLEIQIVSGSITEAYTVLGSEDFTAHLEVVFVNTGAAPMKIEMRSLTAFRQSGGMGTAVYFNPVPLLPSTRGNARINIPAGLSRLDTPVALVYNGVRLELN